MLWTSCASFGPMEWKKCFRGGRPTELSFSAKEKGGALRRQNRAAHAAQRSKRFLPRCRLLRCAACAARMGFATTMQTRKHKLLQYALLLAILAIASLLAMGIAGTLRRGEIVSPPVVEVAGTDAAVITALQAAQEDVRASPRSSTAWGRLGMLLLSYNFLPESRQCFAQAER